MAAERNFAARMKCCAAGIGIAAAAVSAGVAHADDYPSRVVRIVVPTAPGLGFAPNPDALKEFAVKR